MILRYNKYSCATQVFIPEKKNERESGQFDCRPFHLHNTIYNEMEIYVFYCLKYFAITAIVSENKVCTRIKRDLNFKRVFLFCREYFFTACAFQLNSNGVYSTKMTDDANVLMKA